MWAMIEKLRMFDAGDATAAYEYGDDSYFFSDS
jgi:hypothetical protein